MTEKTCPISTEADGAERLPFLALLALAASCFITILTETLPAGLLLPISADLRISEAMAGQLVTAYAIGSLVAAIPLSIATRAWDRRPLLMLTIALFAIINLITAISDSYILTLVVRFLAGMSAGLLWSIIAGYAARMVAPELKGRAIAVAMVGTPLALSLGLPASTFLGQFLGWRAVFVLMSITSAVLLIWIRWRMPNFPGQDARTKLTLRRVFFLSGMRPILLTLFTFILAHNILYTYIAPMVVPSGLAQQLSGVLLVFGIASLASIVLVGSQVDKRLRQLTLGSIMLFVIAVTGLAIGVELAPVVYLGVAAWGLGYGGSATIFQTATAHTAGADIDVAQSMTVVAWNLAIGGGGILGGLLLTFGPEALPLATIPLLLVALVTVVSASKYGFN
ncbi:MFS transporter [Pseudomonas aeruginosa]|uniref:MFS transporter n=1 Tax=Pseudomonas aeruginosa TaxID=287 RepID=UPI00383AD593